MSRQLEIKHSDRGEYYEMYVNGNLIGTYDSVTEAAKDYERMDEEDLQ